MSHEPGCHEGLGNCCAVREGGRNASFGSASALLYISLAVVRVTHELVIVRSSVWELVRFQ